MASGNFDLQFALNKLAPLLALVDLHEHAVGRLQLAKTHCERRMLELHTVRAGLLLQADLIAHAEKDAGVDRGDVVGTQHMDRLLWECNCAMANAEEYLDYIFSLKDTLDQLERISQF